MRSAREPRARRWRSWAAGCLLLASASPRPCAAAEVHPAPPSLTVTSVPKVLSYQLDARLDPSTHVIRAHGTLTWTNPSSTPAHELWFHLYLNAFRDSRSLFLRSPFTSSRTGRRLDSPGGVQVRRLSAERFGARNLWDDAAAHSPRDPDDSTDIRVPLPAPIAPGETVRFELEFESRLPSVVERTGFAGSFHLAGQWFPKLAKREADGTWAHFAFHPHAEFYADFGDYDVLLEVPAAYQLGATGRRIAQTVEGGQRRERYVARGVHDFAWTAWDGFERQQSLVDGVDVTLLSPPGSATTADKTWGALRSALPFFSRRYGRYPYPTLTVVVPPTSAPAAGGMEYPTFITTGHAGTLERLGAHLVEQVTVHELGHQWFQGLIATNEARWPFLDEGLTSDAEWQALTHQFGPASMFQLWDFSVSGEALGRVAALMFGADEPIAQPAADFATMRSLAGLVYSRTAAALATLRGAFGAQAVDASLRRYANEQRFRHPDPADLLQTFRAEAGEHAARALEALLFERGTFDLVVASARSVPHHQTNSSPTHQTKHLSHVVVVRRGEVALPVEVELELESGRVVRRHLEAGPTEWVIEEAFNEPLRAVRVDPEQRLLLDEDLQNNVAHVTRTDEPRRSSERALYWAGLLLHLLGG